MMPNVPNKQDSKINITLVEIENEVKTTKTKKKSVLTLETNNETLQQQNTKQQHEGNVDITNVDNVNTEATNIQEDEIDSTKVKANMEINAKKVIQGFHGGNKPPLYQTKFWVQYSFGGASDMSYDPQRNTFVLLVFSITAIMVSVTALIVGYIYFTEDLREHFRVNGKIVASIGALGMICINYAVMCSPCTRMKPCSVIIVILGVIFMTSIASHVTARFSTDIVFLALLATFVTILVCTALACTSFDFTSYLLYIIAISVALATVSVAAVIMRLALGVNNTLLNIGILVGATLLNVVMIVVQLQMILGGKNVSIGENDYILAAFFLYVSIIDLFLKLLQLLGILGDDD